MKNLSTRLLNWVNYHIIFILYRKSMNEYFMNFSISTKL